MLLKFIEVFIVFQHKLFDFIFGSIDYNYGEFTHCVRF